MIETKKIFVHIVSFTRNKCFFIPVQFDAVAIRAVYVGVSKDNLRLIGDVIKRHELKTKEITLTAVTVGEAKISPEMPSSLIEFSYNRGNVLVLTGTIIRVLAVIHMIKPNEGIFEIKAFPEIITDGKQQESAGIKSLIKLSTSVTGV